MEQLQNIQSVIEYFSDIYSSGNENAEFYFS
jgi:hypothetical protein